LAAGTGAAHGLKCAGEMGTVSVTGFYHCGPDPLMSRPILRCTSGLASMRILDIPTVSRELSVHSMLFAVPSEQYIPAHFRFSTAPTLAANTSSKEPA
jgi:hypothetical protein